MSGLTSCTGWWLCADGSIVDTLTSVPPQTCVQLLHGAVASLSLGNRHFLTVSFHGAVMMGWSWVSSSGTSLDSLRRAGKSPSHFRDEGVKSREGKPLPGQQSNKRVGKRGGAPSHNGGLSGFLGEAPMMLCHQED